MAAAVAASPVGDAALLVKAAESMYQQGNVDRALELYDQASYKADQEKQTISLSRPRSPPRRSSSNAVATLRRLRGFCSSPASIHRIRAGPRLTWHASTTRPIAGGAQDAAALQAGFQSYGEMLDVHVKTWPDHPTTAQARIWLGRLRQQQRDWPAAISAYSGVPPTDARALDAVAALGSCLQRYFAAELAAGRAPNFATAEQALTPFAPGVPARFDSQSPTARSAARTWAQLGLEFAVDQTAPATTVLNQLAATPDCPPMKRSPSTRCSSWPTPRPAAFPKRRCESASRRASLRRRPTFVAARLNSLAAGRPELRSQIAPILLRVVELRRLRGPVPASIVEAEALAAAGRATEALESGKRSSSNRRATAMCKKHTPGSCRRRSTPPRSKRRSPNGARSRNSRQKVRRGGSEPG